MNTKFVTMMGDPEFDIDVDSDGPTEEALTASEVLKQLEEAWLNEKFAPEILENKSDIVDCILEQIQEMEDNIDRAKNGDFKVSIHRLEINRIRYIVSSYLRTRLHKIEKCAAHLIETEKTGNSPKLTAEELLFAEEYHSSAETHFKTLALRHMPQNLQSVDPNQTILKPNLDSYVFLKVNETVEGVMIEEETADNREEVIDLEDGDQHIMRYRPISSLVTTSSVTLI